MFGVWGTTDKTTGNLGSIGFIAKDVACVGGFKAALSSAMDWDTPMPGTEKVLPVLDAANQSYLDTRADPLPTGSPTPKAVVWTTYAGIEVAVPVTDVPVAPAVPADVADAAAALADAAALIDAIAAADADHKDDDHDHDHDHGAEAHDDEKDQDHDDHEGHGHALKASTFDDHTHTVNASSGLVVVAIIVWGIVAIIGVIFIVMYCRERK